jgi:hypothetical protein
MSDFMCLGVLILISNCLLTISLNFKSVLKEQLVAFLNLETCLNVTKVSRISKVLVNSLSCCKE